MERIGGKTSGKKLRVGGLPTLSGSTNFGNIIGQTLQYLKSSYQKNEKVPRSKRVVFSKELESLVDLLHKSLAFMDEEWALNPKY